MFLFILAFTGVFLCLSQLSRGKSILFSLIMLILSLMLLSAAWFFAAMCILVFGTLLHLTSLNYSKRVGILSLVILLAWSPLIVGAYQKTVLANSLRDRYAYVSLQSRLPMTDQVIAETEQSDSDSRPSWFGRAAAIRQVHRSVTETFLSAPEFGVGRMVSPDMRSLVGADQPPISLSSLPASQSSPPSTHLDSATLVSTDDSLIITSNEPSIAPEQDRLRRGHSQAVDYFAPRDSFGDVRSVHEVAGFQSHAIRPENVSRNRPDQAAQRLQEMFDHQRWDDAPDTDDDWRLVRLQLVGLLYEDQPVVYQLDTLPAVASHDTVDKRPLNDFESTGLQRLLDGDEIYTAVDGHQIHMIGALRNDGECRQCHHASETLLGAFSYTLERFDNQDSDSIVTEHVAAVDEATFAASP